MDDPSVTERIEHRRHDEIHTCVRPGCGQRAGVAYYVNSPMRLAGRDFMPGEFVDLCPDDDLDLRRTADEAVALGYGSQFDTPRMRTMLAVVDIDHPNPLDRLKEWRP